MYYLLKDHNESTGIYLQSDMDEKTIKNLIIYLQAKIHLEISEDIYLESEDISHILVKHYNFKEKKMVDISQGLRQIDLVKLWNENIDHIESIITNSKFKNKAAEKDLIKLLDKYKERFIFINVAARLPKWAEDTYIPPLSLEVTHGGVLIQGLYVLTEETRKEILNFYPASKFFDENSLFFSFKDFPPYKYSFTWDGRRISVMEVIETDTSPTEIVKQMNIGYYLEDEDFKFPIKNLKELQILKKKMRLG